MELKPDAFTALMGFGITILILTPIPMCGFFFFPTPSNFLIPAACVTIQLSSDTAYLETVSDSPG